MIAEDKEKEAGADGAVEKKYPYPKSVFFIISTEFCERFSFYGMKSKYLIVAALSMRVIKKFLSWFWIDRKIKSKILVSIPKIISRQFIRTRPAGWYSQTWN